MKAQRMEITYAEQSWTGGAHQGCSNNNYGQLFKFTILKRKVILIKLNIHTNKNTSFQSIHRVYISFQSQSIPLELME